MQALMGGQQLPPGMEQDPLMKLMASLGGGPGGMGGMPDMGGLPPGFASMMGAAGGGGGPMAQAANGPSTHDWIWRIVHGISAVMLAIWVLMSGARGFDGTERAREKSVLGADDTRPVSHIFHSPDRHLCDMY